MANTPEIINGKVVKRWFTRGKARIPIFEDGSIGTDTFTTKGYEDRNKIGRETREQYRRWQNASYQGHTKEYYEHIEKNWEDKMKKATSDKEYNFAKGQRDAWQANRIKAVSHENTKNEIYDGTYSNIEDKSASKMIDYNAKTRAERYRNYNTKYDVKSVKEKMLNDDTIRISDKYESPDGISLNVVAKDVSGKYIVREAGNEYKATESELRKNITDGQYKKVEYDGIRNRNTGMTKQEEQYNQTKKEILNYFGEDYGYEGTPEQALVKQIDYMRNPNESIYNAGKRFAQGGSMLVYNQDMADYLNNKGIKANVDDAFDKYTDYIGKNIEKIYNDTKSNLDTTKATVDRFKAGKNKFTNNEEKYNEINKTIPNLEKMKKDYAKLDTAYHKEYDEKSNEWRKYEYGTPEYNKAYEELSKVSSKYYGELGMSELRDKIAQAEGTKMLQDRGEYVLYDNKGNLAFSPKYESYRDETGKIKDTMRTVDLGIDVRSDTALKDAEILDSITGQISDGIWENSRGMEKYWKNMNFTQENGKITFVTPDKSNYFEPNYFYGKDDKQIKDYLANKAKQIVKIEMKDGSLSGEWDRNNQAELSYMGGHHTPVTVADVYSLYDRLKGRTPKNKAQLNTTEAKIERFKAGKGKTSNNKDISFGEYLEKKFGYSIDRNDLTQEDDDKLYKEYLKWIKK